MAELDKPYFMTKKEWYRFDIDESIYKLTDKAPPKAVKSYKEYYKELDELNLPPKLSVN